GRRQRRRCACAPPRGGPCRPLWRGVAVAGGSALAHPVAQRGASTPTMIVYAHRGAAAERPENTLPSFARALELGADALEMDVHATRDGTLVVSHDPDGARMCNVARVLGEADWAEVSRWDAGWGFRAPDGSRPFAGQGVSIPRLVDVVRAFPGVLLNV